MMSTLKIKKNKGVAPKGNNIIYLFDLLCLLGCCLWSLEQDSCYNYQNYTNRPNGDQKLNSVSEIIHNPIDKPNKSKPIPKSSPYTHLV